MATVGAPLAFLPTPFFDSRIPPLASAVVGLFLTFCSWSYACWTVRLLALLLSEDLLFFQGCQMDRAITAIRTTMTASTHAPMMVC